MEDNSYQATAAAPADVEKVTDLLAQIIRLKEALSRIDDLARLKAPRQRLTSAEIVLNTIILYVEDATREPK